MKILNEQSDATHIRVTFPLQLWVDNRAVAGNDTVTYPVPLEKALTADGDLVKDDTDASDQFVRIEEAPKLARNWQGPFYVTVDEPDAERTPPDTP